MTVAFPALEAGLPLLAGEVALHVPAVKFGPFRKLIALARFEPQPLGELAGGGSGRIADVEGAKQLRLGLGEALVRYLKPNTAQSALR